MERVTKRALAQALVFVVVGGCGFLSSTAVRAADPFRRGDADQSGVISVNDAITVLNFLFFGDDTVAFCFDAADVNDDGTVSATDAVRLLQYLFVGGPAPDPVGRCVHDVSDDALDCAVYVPCQWLGRFLVLDRSQSMARGTLFKQLQAESLAILKGLTPRDQFSVAFFWTEWAEFEASGEPQLAHWRIRDAALSYVLGTSTLPGSTCPKEALLAALRTAARSHIEDRAIVFISDGAIDCWGNEGYAADTLAEFDRENTERIPVTSILLGTFDPQGESFMRALAQQSGGRFVHKTQ